MVVETDLKDEVVVTVVVAATVVRVVAEEMVDVVPVDAETTIISSTKILGIMCPGTNTRQLLRHANVLEVQTI